MPILGFRIYYADGSVWTDADGGWNKAPSQGVQVVMLIHRDDYRTFIMGEDEYRAPTLGNRVKYGQWMTDAGYDAVAARAMRERREE